MATGLLVNQIGYDPGYPARFVFRSHTLKALSGDAKWTVFPVDGRAPVHEGDWHSWGELWKEHWWQAHCTIDKPGSYRLETRDAAGALWSAVFTIIYKPYLRGTFEQVALSQFERRSKIPTVPGQGWIDCGAHLSEANSHAVSVIGMCLFFRERGKEIPESWRERLLRQIRVGSEYFSYLAKSGEAVGLPSGTYQHEPFSNPESWALQDCLQIGIALCMAVAVFRSIDETDTADSLLPFIRNTVKHLEKAPAELIGASRRSAPEGRTNENVQLQYFSPVANVLPEGTPDPDVWMTRELSMLLMLHLEFDALIDESLLEKIETYADALVDRWYDNPAPAVGKPKGWFVTYPGVTQAETSWSHHSVGRDTGAVFPQFVMPLFEAALRFPDHPRAETWRKAALRFLDSYLKPASQANPFSLLPNTFREKDDWLHFAGLWHGMNASYGLAALQAFYFYRHTGQEWLYHFGKAQLDWIAGLNCGLTADSLYGSEMFSRDLPENTALPVSMIHGIGGVYAGSWRTIRGSICNGFSRGRQFNFDVEPIASEDQPDSFTDEDWITHAGAWIGALAFCDL